jgi:hypothetical protein
MIKGIFGSMLNILLLMLNRMLLFVLIIAGVLIAVYITGDNDIFRVLAQICVVVFVPFITVWTARTSYNTKWNTFERSWPVSQTVIVISRYILFVVINLVIALLWLVSPFFDGNHLALVQTAASAYLALAIYYPFLYMMRAGRGDLDTLILTVSAMGSIYGLGHFMRVFGENVGLIMVGIAYIVSLGLSIGFNFYHKGRAT